MRRRRAGRPSAGPPRTSAARCRDRRRPARPPCEPPSKTSSSWPPTAFTYTIHAPVSGRGRAGRRRVRRVLPRWYGEPLMFTMIAASGVARERRPRRARRPRTPTDRRACPPISTVRARRAGHEVAPLVEHAVVRQLHLVVAGHDAASCAAARQRCGSRRRSGRRTRRPRRSRSRSAFASASQRGQVLARRTRGAARDPRADSR